MVSRRDIVLSFDPFVVYSVILIDFVLLFGISGYVDNLSAVIWVGIDSINRPVVNSYLALK